MQNKLSLDRDFTRFLNDPTFPYKVTVCIGDERILCSGALLAQQSSVLEKKFREDDGMLMFEEMVDVENSNQVLHECISYLHGKNLSFASEDIAVVLKFASLYKIKGLFDKCMQWFKWNLMGSKSVKDVVKFLKLSDSLDSSDSARLKSVIALFIVLNKDLVGNQICEFLELGVTGYDIAFILKKKPSGCSDILKKWCSISIENREFILEQHNMFDFKEIFPNSNEFSSFISFISDDVSYTKYMKVLLDIQKLFYTVDIAAKRDESKQLAPGNTSSTAAATQLLSSLSIHDNEVGTSTSCPDSSNITASGKGNLHPPASLNEARPCSLQELLGESKQLAPGDTSSTAAATQLLASLSLSKDESGVGTSSCHDSSSITAPSKGNLHLPLIEARPLEQELLGQQSTASDPNPLESECSESESDGCDHIAFIGNLPPRVIKRDLLRLFRFAGKIVDVQILKDDSVAFVRFESRDSAEKLLDSGKRFVLSGYQLAIVDSSSSDSEGHNELDEEEESEDEEDEDDEEEEESEDGNDEAEVYVRNLPRSVSEDDLRYEFQIFGTIKNVTIFMDGGRNRRNSYAFVKFETVNSARALVSASLSIEFKIKGTALKIGMKSSDGVQGCKPPPDPIKPPRHHPLYNERED